MVVLTEGLLEFHSDTVEVVRKDVNLEKEGRIEEAVDILEDWLKKQQHFVKKDFSREYLERALITAKGLLERAKLKIDKMCTFKTLMPQMHPNSVTKKDYENLNNFVWLALLPKMTHEYYRIYITKLVADNYDSVDILTFYRKNIVLSEYIRRYDYNSGFIIVLDYRDINILNFVTKCTPVELKQMITIMTEGYSIRIKQIHIITASKMADILLALFKQVFSSKLGGRMHLHKNIDTFHEFISEDILPEEYGGTERSLRKLNDEWLDALTAPDFVEYFEEMHKARTNESCRTPHHFNEQYVGMPGSFRALSVD